MGGEWYATIVLIFFSFIIFFFTFAFFPLSLLKLKQMFSLSYLSPSLFYFSPSPYFTFLLHVPCFPLNISLSRSACSALSYYSIALILMGIVALVTELRVKQLARIPGFLVLCGVMAENAVLFFFYIMISSRRNLSCFSS